MNSSQDYYHKMVTKKNKKSKKNGFVVSNTGSLVNIFDNSDTKYIPKDTIEKKFKSFCSDTGFGHICNLLLKKDRHTDPVIINKIIYTNDNGINLLGALLKLSRDNEIIFHYFDYLVEFPFNKKNLLCYASAGNNIGIITKLLNKSICRK